ncbi:MAG: peptidoglycan DD-metalloendopeptidase family protein [candidate division WOR-3 bacterium]
MMWILSALLLASSEAEKYKKELAGVESEIQAVQREIERLGKKEESLVKEIDLLERQEALIAQSIEILKAQERAIQADIRSIEADMTLAEARGRDAKAKLSLATRLLYITPKPDFLKAFLDFGSVYTAYRRVKYLRRLALYEKNLIKRLIAITQRLSKLRELKTRALADLSVNRLKLKQKEDMLAQTRQEKERAIERVRKQRDRKEKYLAQLEKSREELKAIIKRLQEKQGKVATMKGVKLLTPCEGELVGRFGLIWNDKYGTQIKNNGIDIKAPKGSEIKAAAAGKVAYVGWLEGYGSLVILEHDGFYTVYSRLDKVLVSEGTKVVKGTVLGKLGAEPLHFELRVGGEAVDPEGYLF